MRVFSRKIFRYPYYKIWKLGFLKVCYSLPFICVRLGLLSTEVANRHIDCGYQQNSIPSEKLSYMPYRIVT